MVLYYHALFHVMEKGVDTNFQEWVPTDHVNQHVVRRVVEVNFREDVVAFMPSTTCDANQKVRDLNLSHEESSLLGVAWHGLCVEV